MNTDVQQALTTALYKVLRPMVRLLIRHGVSYRLFADVARHVYVDVAEQDFSLDGRKPSNARTAVMTGINRKDIAKLKNRPHPLSEAAVDSPTPAARVITAWLNDGNFHSDQGEPLDLIIDEDDEGNTGAPSFAALAREYSSDVPVRALLDELERIAAIEKIGTNQVRLIVKGYVPIQDMRENLRIFGTAAADLLRTMDHNIAGAETGKLIQRTVSYSDIPIEMLPHVRQRSRTEIEAFLLQANAWLAECDRTENKELVGSGKTRAGIGIYYIEHLADE